MGCCWFSNDVIGYGANATLIMMIITMIIMLAMIMTMFTTMRVDSQELSQKTV